MDGRDSQSGSSLPSYFALLQSWSQNTKGPGAPEPPSQPESVKVCPICRASSLLLPLPRPSIKQEALLVTLNSDQPGHMQPGDPSRRPILHSAAGRLCCSARRPNWTTTALSPVCIRDLFSCSSNSFPSRSPSFIHSICLHSAHILHNSSHTFC